MISLETSHIEKKKTYAVVSLKVGPWISIPRPGISGLFLWVFRYSSSPEENLNWPRPARGLEFDRGEEAEVDARPGDPSVLWPVDGVEDKEEKGDFLSLGDFGVRVLRHWVPEGGGLLGVRQVSSCGPLASGCEARPKIFMSSLSRADDGSDFVNCAGR